MPRLRQLQLKYCCIQDSDLILPSQLPTVTDISLICISVDDQVNILDRCKAIRRLSTSGSLSELTHPTPIILPDLEYLWYSHRHWSLLDYLTLPPESHLHILRAIDDATAFNLFTRFSQALNPQASVPDTPTRIHHLTLFYNKSRLGVHAKDGVDKDIATFGVQISLYNTDYPLFFASILALSQTATIGIQSMNINAPGQCSIFFSAFRRHHRIATIKIEGFPGISSLLAFPDIRNPACTTGQINPQGFTSRIHTSCGCKHCHDERVSSYPGLQTLILYLGLTDVNDEVPLGRNTSRPWSEMLLDWLGERKLKGLGLTNLELHCNLAENKEGLDKLSTRLRQVVTNVNVTVRTNMSGLPTSSVFPTPLYDSYRRRILLH
ncbi:hypothetical protein AX16_005044 [Volvariella volvacea WC 439]|nr:hypothetical protein AX16_005044 [Volvariella volvacea WC 439]